MDKIHQVRPNTALENEHNSSHGLLMFVEYCRYIKIYLQFFAGLFMFVKYEELSKSGDLI